MQKNELDRLLTSGIITGKNPRELARRLKKTFAVETSKAERLMRTELSRVRIASQEQSLKANGFDKYEFIALGDACGTCKGLDGKTFTLKQLKISGNAPPMHPNCRCAIAPATNDPEYEAWLDGFYKHGLSFEEWKKKQKYLRFRRNPDSDENFITNNEIRKDVIKPKSIRKNLMKTKVGQETLKYIKENNLKINLIYGREFPKNTIGIYNYLRDTIEIDCDSTKTIQKTAEIIVHEVTHRKYNNSNLTLLEEEIECWKAEALHRNAGNLTDKEYERIIKKVKELYHYEDIVF